jgi:hypothetical protein
MGNLTVTLTPYQDKLTLSLVERSVERSLMYYLAGEQAGCSSTRLAAVAPRCSIFTTKAASALSCIEAARSIERSLPPSAHMVDDSRVEPTISSSLRYFITASSRVFYPRVDSISVVKYGIKQRIELEYLDYCAEWRWQGLSALSVPLLCKPHNEGKGMSALLLENEPAYLQSHSRISNLRLLMGIGGAIRVGINRGQLDQTPSFDGPHSKHEPEASLGWRYEEGSAARCSLFHSRGCYFGCSTVRR